MPGRQKKVTQSPKSIFEWIPKEKKKRQKTKPELGEWYRRHLRN